MKKWIDYFFGMEHTPSHAFLLAGSTSRELQERIVSGFDKVKNYRDEIQQYYVVSSGSLDFVIIFNLYGAPSVVDNLAVLKAGGTKKLYFVGFAGTRRDYNVGDLFVPNTIRCLDGLVNFYDPTTDLLDVPKDRVDALLRYLNEEGLQFHKGMAASIPSVFHSNDRITKELELDERICAYEMELASAVYFSRKNRLHLTPLLIISDNQKQGLPDGFAAREQSLYSAFLILKLGVLKQRI